MTEILSILTVCFIVGAITLGGRVGSRMVETRLSNAEQYINSSDPVLLPDDRERHPMKHFHEVAL